MTNKVSIYSVGIAPTVTQADNGWLDAETNRATVAVSYTGIQIGDTITLYWRGDKSGTYSSSQTVSYRGTQYFFVPANYIEPNLSVSVSYLYEPYDNEEGKGQWVSNVLTLKIRHPLTAPTVPESEDGWLDSATNEATVVIEPYKRMAAGDRVDMYWTGDQSGVYDDYVPISEFAVGQQLSFPVPASKIVFNTSVIVRYTVTYVSGIEQDSGVLALSIKNPIIPGN